MKTAKQNQNNSEYSIEAPKVSVIIPVHNVEQYIAKCLDSLKEQSLKELELIFVDDKSSDRSMEAVEQASKEDKRIRILYNEENIGPGPSRNRGIEIARGEFLNFLDPDDYVAQDFYEKLYELAREKEADIVKGHVTAVNEEGSPVDGWHDPSKNIENQLNKGHLLYRSFDSEHFSAIFRGDFVTNDPELRYGNTRVGEDSVFLLKVLLKNPRFFMTHECEYYHMVREESLENNITFESCMEGLKALENRIGVLEKHAYPEESYKYLQGSMKYYTGRFFKTDVAQTDENIRKQNRKMFKCRLDEVLSKCPEPVKITNNNKAYEKLSELTLNETNISEKKADIAGASSSPKVSVIIPVYKCESFMDDTLRMVRGQTLRDIEILCVLDGPDEYLRGIIEKHAAEDARIICLEQEHGGAGTARNTGLERAKGEYLLFLDADDLFEPHMLERLYLKAVKHNADTAMCSFTNYNIWLNEKLENQGFDFSKFSEEEVTDCTKMKDLYEAIYQAPWDKMFRREFINKLGIRFSKTRIMNDVFFVIAAMTSTKRLVVIKDDLLTVRRYVNSDSISTNRARYTEDCIIVLEEVYQWLKANGLWKKRCRDYYFLTQATLHYQASYDTNEKFIDGMARLLSKEQPWKSMSNVKLVQVLELYIKKLVKSRNIVLDELNSLKGLNIDNSGREHRLHMCENKLNAIRKIRKYMKEKYGRDLSKRDNPLAWFKWSLEYRGLKGTVRRINDKLFGEKYLEPKNVVCSGHITTAGHYLTFFLPAKIYCENVKVEDLSVVVRCNGYYPIAVSGHKGVKLTTLGPRRTPVISGGGPMRRLEVRRVVAEVSPGLGILIHIRFKESLLKNKNGEKVSNNHPASVQISGKIELR